MPNNLKNRKQKCMWPAGIHRLPLLLVDFTGENKQEEKSRVGTMEGFSVISTRDFSFLFPQTSCIRRTDLLQKPLMVSVNNSKSSSRNNIHWTRIMERFLHSPDFVFFHKLNGATLWVSHLSPSCSHCWSKSSYIRAAKLSPPLICECKLHFYFIPDI